MPIAVFTDPNGLITHIVKTDGANADADLKVHTDALIPGHAFLRIEDAQYSTMKHDDLVAAVEAVTKLPAISPAPPPRISVQSADELAALQAFKAAYDTATAQGSKADTALTAAWKALNDSYAADAVLAP